MGEMIRDLIYPLVLGMIKVWKAFTFVIIYAFGKPLKSLMKKEFHEAGIEVNGKAPQDIQVHNEMFYRRFAQDEILGFAEAYMDGWFDIESMDEFTNRLIRQGVYKKYFQLPWNKICHYLEFQLFNNQTAKRSYEVGRKHYDLSNALFESFLDKTMNYSCGYWKNAGNLDEAQQHKMELICQKLKLEPGMRVLDAGCGWGGLAYHMAKNYGVSVVAITISVEGAKVSQERCKGLPVEVRVQDYRDLDEKFDRIASIGILEHVGRKNYRTFFQMADRCLPNYGILLVHTIGKDSEYVFTTEGFFHKYIFPNGELPDHTNIPVACNELFTIEDWHNFGAYYDKTLLAWRDNFQRNWPTIEHLFEDSKRFYRMWNLYLSVSAGAFRSRKLQLWQIVLAKNGVVGGYESVR